MLTREQHDAIFGPSIRVFRIIQARVRHRTDDSFGEILLTDIDSEVTLMAFTPGTSPGIALGGP
jgi:hypothetical protein